MFKMKFLSVPCLSAKGKKSEILIVFRQCQLSSCVCGLACHALKGASPSSSTL